MKIVDNVLMDVEPFDLISKPTDQSVFGRIFGKGETKKVLKVPEGVKAVDELAMKKIFRIVNEVEFPESIERIGDGLFAGSISLEKINLPENLEYLGASAFEDCINLKEIKFSTTRLKEIKPQTFSGCSSLKSIKLPDSIEKIGNFAFSSCTKLQSLNLPKNMKEISNGAFRECSNLKSINLNDNLEKIGSNAFEDCRNLIAIKFPKSLKSIGDGAFCDCVSLKKIKIPEMVREIQEETFSGCKYLKVVELPENIKDISDGAFKMCTSITEIRLPSKLKNIGFNAFFSCDSLKSISIPGTVEFIGEKAFANCWDLVEVKIDEGVKNIGKMAFADCHKLTKVSLPDSVKKIGGGTFESCDNLTQVKLPNNLTEIPFKMFNYCSSLKCVDIPETVKSIGELAFAHSAIKEIDIPEMLESIDDGAFANCKKLIGVILGENIKSYGDGLFENCENLYYATLPNNLQRIPDSMFYGCYQLKHFEIPESVKVIENNAFNGCASIREIKLPKELEKIGDFAFYDCSEISDIKIPKTVQSIGASAFENCTNLYKITIPKQVKEIKNSTFQNCYGLTFAIFPDELEVIGDNAFSNCSSLIMLEFPKKLKEIGANAFMYCRDIDNPEFPDGLKKIGEGAFDGCTRFSEVIIPDSVESIGPYTFAGCENIENVKLPKNIENLGEYMFSGCSKLGNVSIPKSVKNLGDLTGTNFAYITEKDNETILSSKKLDNENNCKKINVSQTVLGKFWNDRNIIMQEQANPRFADLYNNFVARLSTDSAQKFINSHNFKFLKQFNLPEDESDREYCYKMLYNLGGFDKPFVDENGKIVDYAQKVANFLLEKIKKDKFKWSEVPYAVENMNIMGFKREFTDFFMQNFDEIWDEDYVHKNFFAKCYNEFEMVQKTNTSHRGSQRQLKPTVEKFKQYFRQVGFSGVNEGNKNIAETLKPYFLDQSTFEHAIAIDCERKRNNVPNGLTEKTLSEKEVFAGIDDYVKKINDIQVRTLSDLTKIANNEFTFEWLKKNDPRNFILGKLCSCCAHLEGAGYGIMHASIVDKNVQNIVIKNGDGEIIGKSTLYINPEQGYGVCNNFSLNKGIFANQRDSIYKKFILGITTFAEEYNKEHPDKPLKIITIGMHLNSLEGEIKKYNIRSKKLYKAISYGDYGIDYNTYNGDSDESQYVIWKANEFENEKDI